MGRVLRRHQILVFLNKSVKLRSTASTKWDPMITEVSSVPQRENIGSAF